MTEIRGASESERRSQLRRQLLREMDDYHVYRRKRRQRIIGTSALVLLVGLFSLPFLLQQRGKFREETVEQQPGPVEPSLPSPPEIAETPGEAPESVQDEGTKFAVTRISDEELLILLEEIDRPATFAMINGEKRLLHLRNDPYPLER